MEVNQAVGKRQVAIAFVLGIVSLLAVGIAVLALTDIQHGESDLRQEWLALRVCFALVFIFQVFALVTLWRMLGNKNGGIS